jgi:hypothetical protein
VLRERRPDAFLVHGAACETHSEQNSSPTTMHDALFPLVLVFGPGMLILLSTVSIFQFTTLFKGTAP